MITLVTTVLNDRQGCLDFFRQVAFQTKLPDEVVIVDGGSNDGTWKLLCEFKFDKEIKLIAMQDKGCNVARGRNIAIRNASHGLIVSTDVGCELDNDWIENLVRPLENDANIEAVMGSWYVPWDSLTCPWAKVEFATQREFTFVATPDCHASSRSIAYRKSLWERIGGYPEDLTLAGDDLAFAYLLHAETNLVAADTVPRVKWGRLTGLRAYRREAKRNFIGIGEAGLCSEFETKVTPALVLEIVTALSLFMTFVLWIVGVVDSLTLLLVAACVLLAWSRRIFRWLRTSITIFKLGEASLVWRVPVFDIAIRWNSVVGYWIGRRRGKQQCVDCRRRLLGQRS